MPTRSRSGGQNLPTTSSHQSNASACTTLSSKSNLNVANFRFRTLDGFSFTFTSTSVTFFDVVGTADDAPYLFPSLTFWASSGGGGVVAGDGGGGSQNFNQEGDQIYSGSTSAPVFSEGTFNLCVDGPRFCDTLTVSANIGDSPDIINATPLPSTWLML